MNGLIKISALAALLPYLALATTNTTRKLDVSNVYSYKGQNAGNVAGSYDQVTSLAGCAKSSVSKNSPVGPMSDEIGMVFRGPMEIENIAVYQYDSAWTKVSSYDRSSMSTDNLVFMNNQNIDYTGGTGHGPQGFATADGTGLATEPTVLSGSLGDGSYGTEVNILTASPCSGNCDGYSGDNDYHGWGTGKKIFVTKVQMPAGSADNRPGIWILPAQVLHSGQYGCNCRGMGPVGGCGELDIAEVIETNIARDAITTHYYFYDGSILSPGGDNFAPRPFDAPTVYVVVIDDSGEGLIKIAQLNDFDFSQSTFDQSLLDQLVSA